MNKRLRRTALNWRWWLTLPLYLPMVAICLMSMALESAADTCGDICRWVREGGGDGG